ncbi:hypothetical protein ORI20_06720 [Mycobacterium sp. CVI_P3]|uniref:DUF4386 domain-containing protein n=1 Tax=Mycobacterium pinniadriaticum TaxID=2994102 RepID=A0ABT3SA44_9MYCO|nr:hypothetical protein [Mycobacterium pinniadriaticum]MCX2929957.1 hypothetical protein [Mycobacterium pinniadriaticum]MCX2936394.1 hypothetical protein [Mycobacterium pinniadriaticum]
MTTTDAYISAARQPSTKTDFTLLRAALWSVCFYCGLGLLGFAVFAGFWPPPGEDLDAAGITQYFQTHGTAIRIGMVLMVVGAPCYYTWSVALSKIISRMEGPMGPLSMTELVGGLMTALVTAVPAVVWQTATFRSEGRSPETMQTLYDFGWLFFDLTFMFSFLQSVALGIAILIDRRSEPLFPRWVAYVCFLTAAVYIPLSLVPFVRTGPFAWHGVLNFWAVFVMFFVLIAVLTPYAFRALRRLEQE